MNKKKQIRKELKNYLDSKLEKGDLHIFDEVVNFIKKDRKKQLTLTDVSNSLLELKKHSIDEIENYLDTIGYSIIKTTELDYLEEKLMNYTG